MLVEETDPVPVLTVYPATSRRATMTVLAGASGIGGVLVVVAGITLVVRDGPATIPLIVQGAFFGYGGLGFGSAAVAGGRPSLRVTAAGITRLDAPGRATFVAWADVIAVGSGGPENANLVIGLRDKSAVLPLGGETLATPTGTAGSRP